MKCLGEPLSQVVERLGEFRDFVVPANRDGFRPCATAHPVHVLQQNPQPRQNQPVPEKGQHDSQREHHGKAVDDVQPSQLGEQRLPLGTERGEQSRGVRPTLHQGLMGLKHRGHLTEAQPLSEAKHAENGPGSGQQQLTFEFHSDQEKCSWRAC